MYRILIAGVALALAGATAAHAEEKKNNPALGAATEDVTEEAADEEVSLEAILEDLKRREGRSE